MRLTVTPGKGNQLTVTIVEAGSGAVVEPDGTWSCPDTPGHPAGTCASTFSASTVITLHARPSTGFRFAGWTGACSGGGDCSLKLSSDRRVSAHFVADPSQPAEPFTVTILGNGEIWEWPEGRR